MTQMLNIIPPPETDALQGARDATRRCGFSPEALGALDRTIEDVCRELATKAWRTTTAPCAQGLPAS